MKKQLLALLGGATLVAGGAMGVAFAAPGPNGHNNHGLCTAYFNGSENGRSNKAKAGPFVALENAANARDGQDNDDDGQTDEADEIQRAVWDFCTGASNPKGVGGNPENPYTEGADGNGKNGRGNG